MTKRRNRQTPPKNWGEEETGDVEPTQKTRSARERRLLDGTSVGLGLLVGAFGVFMLPYGFPPQEPTAGSTSYVIGFNNRVAVLAVLATGGFFCLRSLWWRQRSPEPVDAVILGRRSGRPWLSMPKSVLVSLIALHVAQASFFYAYVPVLDMFGEPIALLPRIVLGLEHHLLPFRDISWPYGLGLYYLPQGFIVIAAWFGGTPALGYFLCYLTCASLGLWALFYVVDHLRIKVTMRVVIFCILALTCDDLSMGLQYTLLRFATPFALALWIHRGIVDAPAGSEGRSLWRACLAAPGAALVVASISCEVGIAYAVGQTAYFLHRAWFGRRAWLGGALATVAAAAAILLGFPGSLVSLSGFSQGAYNFPVLFCPHMVIYLLSLFWVLPMAARACWTRCPGESVSLLLAWSAMIVAMIPGALGRCDSGHVFFYGLGGFLLTLGVLARFRSWWLPVYAITFFAVFGIAARVGGYLSFTWNGQMADVFAAISGAPVDLAKTSSPLVAPLKLDRYRSIAVPLNCDPPTRRYLIDTHRLAVQYHPDLITVRTSADVEGACRDLQRAEAVLAPAWVLELKGVPDIGIQQMAMAKRCGFSLDDHLLISMMFLRPVRLRPIRPSFEPSPLVARYLADHFAVVEKSKDYLLMVYRPETGKPSSAVAPTSVGP